MVTDMKEALSNKQEVGKLAVMETSEVTSEDHY